MDIKELIYSLNHVTLADFRFLDQEDQTEVNVFLREGSLKEIADQILQWESHYPSIPRRNIAVSKNPTYPILYLDLEVPLALDLTYFVFFIKDNEKLSSTIETFKKQVTDLISKKEYKQYFFVMPKLFAIELGRMLAQKVEIDNSFCEAFLYAYYAQENGQARLTKEDFNMLEKGLTGLQELHSQLKKKYGEQIKVYRGGGDLSTPCDEAGSWTTDINMAYRFARSVSGKEQKYLWSGYVTPEAVLDVSNVEEDELLCRPGSVFDIKRTNLL